MNVNLKFPVASHSDSNLGPISFTIPDREDDLESESEKGFVARSQDNLEKSADSNESRQMSFWSRFGEK